MRNARIHTGFTRFLHVFISAVFLFIATGCSAMGVKEESRVPTVPADSPPALYVTYVNHVHLARDYLPFDSKTTQVLDESRARNVLETVEALASILGKFGMKATWNPVYGVAKGLCLLEGPDHVFRRLVASNHEVGVHFHGAQDLGVAMTALKVDCGIAPTNISGLLTHANPVNGVRRSVVEGIYVAPITFSGSRLVVDCRSVPPRANTMYEETGNWLHTWKPNYGDGQLCVDEPTSDFTFVDHGDMSWTGLAGNQQRDLFSETDFSALKQEFDDALAYVERERPEFVTSWAFVTHPHEFMRGKDGLYGPDGATLGRLETLLSYMKQKEAEGLVAFATISEVAAARVN